MTFHSATISANLTPVRFSSDPDALAAYVLGRFDAPAFIRRARNVAEAYEILLERCRRRREELLREVRRALAALQGINVDVSALAAALGTVEASPVSLLKPRQIRQAARELAAAVERFNQRWLDYLKGVNLSDVNCLRDGYNRYYVLEKECALRSAALAQIGFQPLPVLCAEDLAVLFPVLPSFAA
jgi:hypothetical protein